MKGDFVLKILVITTLPWREDCNTGNSYSNIFKDMSEIEFAHIYCRDGMPKNSIAHKYFQITEKRLIKNLINKNVATGRTLYFENAMDNGLEMHSSAYNKMRILRWQILFWGREFIWKISHWESNELNKFIDDFNPDLIFAPLANLMYLNNIILYVKNRTNKPLVTYAWDDVYTFKQFSLSPLFWIDRVMQRRKIRQVANKSEYLYVISDIQKKEFSKLLNKECRLLYKGHLFEGDAQIKKKLNSPLKLVYMGNISSGRWKALAKMSEALERINVNGLKAQLFIYTLSPKSDKMLKELNRGETSRLMDVVPPEEVEEIHKNADILIQVEPLSLKDMLTYRLSFSTKIVDYFSSSRCILAYGGAKTATMDYLKRYDAGIVVDKSTDIEKTLRNLIDNPELIQEYAKKAWKCGKKNHQIKDIQSRVQKDFGEICKLEH